MTVRSITGTLAATLVLATGCFAAPQPVRLVPAGELHGLPGDLPPPGPIVAVAYAPAQGLVALEATGQRLIRIDAKGGYVDENGGFGFGDGATRGATDLTGAGFELWVADPLAGRIVRYDRWMAPLEPFASYQDNSESVPFERPRSVGRSNSGDITVLERDRLELLLLDPDTRLVERVAGFGEIGGGMSAPNRIEAAGDGRVAIADPGRRAVLLLDRFGSFAGKRPWPLTGDGPTGAAFDSDQVWVCGEGGVVLFGPFGSVIGQWGKETFSGPVTDIAILGNQLAAAIEDKVVLFSIIRGK